MSAPPPKIIVSTATALLAVCAAVFTFTVLTRAEAWLQNRQAAARDKSAVTRSGGDDGSDWYHGDGGPPPITAESDVTEANPDIVSDDGPPATPLPGARTPTPQPHASGNSGIAPPRPSGTPPQEGNLQYAPRYAPAQTTARFTPPAGPAVPFMIDNAPPTLPLFALTFDGGSIANAAGEILDTLASRGVSSTMFLTGEFIRKFPGVAARIAAEGHELGNHTQRHPRLTAYSEDRTQSTRPGVTRQLVISELTGAARILADRTGLRFAPLWRAPYGEHNRQICGWALEAGYLHIGWRQGGSWAVNLDTNDWVPDENQPGYRSPEEVLSKITAIASKPQGLNGGIILMHLGTERKARAQQVHTALGRMIDTLRGMGYEPVTVSELLYRTGIDVNTLAFQNAGPEAIE